MMLYDLPDDFDWGIVMEITARVMREKGLEVSK